MPVVYTIDAERKLIHTRCLGRVTFEEIVAHFHELAADPARPDELDVLLDLSESASLPEPAEVKAVSHELERVRDQLRFGAIAILAPRDVMFGMMRMFEAAARPYFRAIFVFREAQEAEQWLAAQRKSSQ